MNTTPSTPFTYLKQPHHHPRAPQYLLYPSPNNLVTNLSPQLLISPPPQFYHIFAAALVFFMQAGFAMLCAGSVRAKNAKNIMLKNLLDACGAALGFYALGWGFAYGGADADVKTFIGDADFFLHQNADGHHAFFFQFAFAATAATIVAGTIAERCSMIAYLCYSTILTAFTYPIVAHAIWSKSGFLSAFNNDPIFGCGGESGRE